MYNINFQRVWEAVHCTGMLHGEGTAYRTRSKMGARDLHMRDMIVPHTEPYLGHRHWIRELGRGRYGPIEVGIPFNIAHDYRC